MSKADYVRSEIAQGHDGKHPCHWPGCDLRVSPAQWGCRKHWYRLPQGIRNRIWAAFKPGQEKTKTPSAAYIAAAREAQDWIREHGGSFVGHSEGLTQPRLPGKSLFERMTEAQRID